MTRQPTWAAWIALAAAASEALCARAQEADAAAAQVLGAEIEELRRALAARDQVIRNLISRIEQLERAVGAADLAQAVPATPAEPAAGASTAPVEAPSSPPGAAAPAPELAADDQQLIRAAFERTLIERGGLLLPAGTFELEPTLTYAHSSAESLVIDGFTIFPVLVVGDIFSERRQRSTTTMALTARFGLPWKSQLELRVPFLYEDISRVTGDGEEIKAHDSGRGDIELAWSRDLPRPFGRGPQWLGSLRWKAATAQDPFGLDAEEELPFGSGFETLSASLTGVTVLDPVVFFGTLSYTEAIGDYKGDARINPGDTWGLQFGMAIALNLETSMSVIFDQSSTERTQLDGVEVPGTYINAGTLSIGVTRSLPSGRSIGTNLVIGLSEDSPDLQVGFAVPFRPGSSARD
jgi:hypothetical protein